MALAQRRDPGNRFGTKGKPSAGAAAEKTEKKKVGMTEEVCHDTVLGTSQV